MSFNNDASEKQKLILSMLESGKITTAEATELLAAISNSTSNTPSNEPLPNSHRPQKETDTSSGVDFDKLEELGRSLTKKIGIFAKDVEPKLRKMTEVVVETTATAADKISKSIATVMEEEKVKEKVNKATPPTKSSGITSISTSGKAEKNFEIRVVDKGSELILTGLNGNVMLKGYNGDKISAKVYSKSTSADASVNLVQLGNKYVFDYDENKFKSVNIEAYIPEFMFDRITASTINGTLGLTTLNAVSIEVENSNGNVVLEDLKCENISCELNNGALNITNVTSRQAKLENFGGNISVTGLDVGKLQMDSFNGAINMLVPNLMSFTDYNWSVEASNASLSIAIPSGKDIGYHIKAHTTLNSIKIGLTGISYIANSDTDVEAKSFNYDEVAKRMKLNLQTSNGSLVIN